MTLPSRTRQRSKAPLSKAGLPGAVTYVQADALLPVGSAAVPGGLPLSVLGVQVLQVALAALGLLWRQDHCGWGRRREDGQRRQEDRQEDLDGDSFRGDDGGRILKVMFGEEQFRSPLYPHLC